nr:helix-turn-helix domain-containing protein [uncultured Pseudodesulfovibrio sp.]
MDTQKLLLNIQETADILRVHRSTVSRMLDSGELPSILVRSRKLIRYADVLEFIENQIGRSKGGYSWKD